MESLLMKSANISEEKQMLCRVTITDLTFVFNQTKGKCETDAPVKLELKETFITNNSKKSQDSQASRRSGPPREKDLKKTKQKVNPLRKDGQPTRCAKCDSIMHWIKDWPHNNELYIVYKYQRQLFQSVSDGNF